MSKERWIEAHEFLIEVLGREPTEDEIIDHLSAPDSYFYDQMKEKE